MNKYHSVAVLFILLLGAMLSCKDGSDSAEKIKTRYLQKRALPTSPPLKEKPAVILPMNCGNFEKKLPQRIRLDDLLSLEKGGIITLSKDGSFVSITSSSPDFPQNLFFDKNTTWYIYQIDTIYSVIILKREIHTFNYVMILNRQTKKHLLDFTYRPDTFHVYSNDCSILISLNDVSFSPAHQHGNRYLLLQKDRSETYSYCGLPTDFAGVFGHKQTYGTNTLEFKNDTIVLKAMIWDKDEWCGVTALGYNGRFHLSPENAKIVQNVVPCQFVAIDTSRMEVFYNK